VSFGTVLEGTTTFFSTPTNFKGLKLHTYYIHTIDTVNIANRDDAVKPKQKILIIGPPCGRLRVNIISERLLGPAAGKGLILFMDKIYSNNIFLV
jgi:hypothetical protein